MRFSRSTHIAYEAFGIACLVAAMCVVLVMSFGSGAKDSTPLKPNWSQGSHAMTAEMKLALFSSRARTTAAPTSAPTSSVPSTTTTLSTSTTTTAPASAPVSSTTVLASPSPVAPPAPQGSPATTGATGTTYNGLPLPNAEQVAEWGRVNLCEEGGNWHVEGSLYAGGLGISRTNWRAYGGVGDEAAADPVDQIAVAMNIEARAGSAGFVPDQNGCASW